MRRKLTAVFAACLFIMPFLAAAIMVRPASGMPANAGARVHKADGY